VTLASPLPWWLVLPAAAVTGWAVWRTWAGAASLSTRRRATLCVLRLAALLLLLVLVMRPVAVTPRPPARDGRVAILVDDSRSMALRDAGDQSRREAARALVTGRILPALEPVALTEVVAFGGPDQPATPGDAIRHALRTGRFPLRAAIVVSDGALATEHDETPAGVPVHAIGVGGSDASVDREVLDVTLGDPTISDAIVQLTATLAVRGATQRPVEVRLLEDDRVAEVRTLPSPDGGGTLRAVFLVSPRRDRPTVYTVEIPPTPGELTPDNNRVRALAAPPGRPRRVLMVEGAPGFEHSFLKRAWFSDPGLRVDAVVRKGENDLGASTFYVQAPAAELPLLASGLPSRPAALFAYDAVVLANTAPDELSTGQLDALRRFVADRGGGLLAFGARLLDPRGLAGTRLEPMLPVGLPGEGADLVVRAGGRGAAGAVAATPDGASHPVMRLGPGDPAASWADLPALSSIARMGGPRPGATVLAVGEAPGGGARPLVAAQRYGEGRVLAFLGDASWRWKMQVPSGDTRYDTFWRQALRWVAAGAPGAVAVEPDAGPGAPGVVVTVRDEAWAAVADARVAVRASDAAAPAGTAAAAPSDERVATLRDAANGLYAARLPRPAGTPVRIEAVAWRGDREIGRGESWVLDGGRDSEMADPRRNDLALARLVRARGGRLLASGDFDDVARWLNAGPQAGSVVTGRDAVLAERELWHTPAVFLGLVVVLGVEWGLRRRWGLA
jgi:uncharacterized membrane protein